MQNISSPTSPRNLALPDLVNDQATPAPADPSLECLREALTALRKVARTELLRVLGDELGWQVYSVREGLVSALAPPIEPDYIALTCAAITELKRQQKRHHRRLYGAFAGMVIP
jgi:hypothetical protein